MALTPGGLLVKAPKCEKINYGLLSVVDPIPSNQIDSHWTSGGFEWEDFYCSPGVTGFIDVCEPVTGFTKLADRSTDFCSTEPFVLVGSYQCPPVGRPADEAFEIARQRLLRWEQRQLERTVWTGEIANGTGFINPSFSFGNTACNIDPVSLTTGTAVNPVEAISLLEEALGDTAGCGIIHASDRLASYFKTNKLLEKIDGGYYSPMGFRVVLGQGYPGSGPANTPASAGESWIFATGPMIMARSGLMQFPSNVQEGMNRNINDIEVRAERFYGVGFSCGLFAVQTDLVCC